MTDTSLAAAPIVAPAQNETAATSAAAHAQAVIQARYLIARATPRNIDEARLRLLADCKRPGFAKSAKYNKPIGDGVSGPSIRFVEAALRHLGNIDTETLTTYDDDKKRIVRVSITDLETNTTYARDITITKTVERRRIKEGQAYLTTRLNSYGDTLYIIPAVDDEILNKEGALISKCLRTLGLRIIPGDLIEEAMALTDETVKNETAKDPDAERRALLDAFGSIGVSPVELASYLGRELTALSPAELLELRAIYSTIKEGEATWQEVAATKEEQSAEQSDTKSSEVKRKLEERKAAKRAGSGSAPKVSK